MDYLRSFIIGTSGLITIPHFAYFAFEREKTKDYPFIPYSVLAPIYYGLANMFALFLGKRFGFSLQKRLFITSLISITLIFILSYTVTKQKYEPYKSYTTKDWIYYLIRNGMKHLAAFNLLIYNFEKYFSQVFLLKVFLIGNSAISYIINFYKVIQLYYLKKINYDYRYFSMLEPLSHGINLVLLAVVLKKILNISMRKSIFIGSLAIPTIWTYGACCHGVKYYNLSKKELIQDVIVIFIYSLIKYNVVLYNLIKMLK